MSRHIISEELHRELMAVSDASLMHSHLLDQIKKYQIEYSNTRKNDAVPGAYEASEVFIVMRKDVVLTTSGYHDTPEASIWGVYDSMEAALDRISRIDKVNPQYEMVQEGNRWYIGPDRDEDQGFFGHTGKYFWIETKEIKS